MSDISGLKPQSIWNFFKEVSSVPRPSKREEKIISYLITFAESRGLEYRQDTIGNVVILKAATPGKESSPTIILQSHVDMVCEKMPSVIHDFDNDPIVPIIDGEWVTAEGTTLGADCGIGVAAQLAVLDSNELVHGPIEALFTVDEETGLTGAFEIEQGMLTGDILLNLDSEDEGELYIGCAGGVDTLAAYKFDQEPITENVHPMKVTISGLKGGHSGGDIHKELANANKLLTRFLWEIDKKYGIRLAEFNGGNLRNAIARDAYATFVVPFSLKESITVDLNLYRADLEIEWLATEPDITISIETTDRPKYVIDLDCQQRLLSALYVAPHGVLYNSTRMPNMVETSTNLASVKFVDDDRVMISTSQRSELTSRKVEASERLQALFTITGAKVTLSDGYPGWLPNPDSKVLKVAQDSYRDLFKKEAKVLSVHAGLECGLFMEKFPDLDIVSFGPTITGAHSPDERLNIKTVSLFWDHLVEMLKRL